MIIIDLIRELMYQQNISIQDIVRETGLSYEIVNNIVTKEIIPTPEYAEVILNYLGMTLEEVLTLY